MSVLERDEAVMTIKEIMDNIPHAYPFLLVDRVVSIDQEEKVIEAIKNVTINEPFFEGHFPNQPIMPGVLIVEALAQTGALYISKMGIEGLKVLVGINNFRFRRPVYPGDTLRLKVTITHMSAIAGKCIGEAFVGDQVCAKGELMFSLIKDKKGKED